MILRPFTCDYREEFPDFGELDVQLPAGFKDASWHNDAMPSFALKLPCGNSFRLWIDYLDPNLSEVHAERFVIHLYDENEEPIGDVLYETNNFEHMKIYISQYLRKYR